MPEDAEESLEIIREWLQAMESESERLSKKYQSDHTAAQQRELYRRQKKDYKVQ